jgi:hypothetical protein
LRLNDAPVSDFALGGHGKVLIDGNTATRVRPLFSDRLWKVQFEGRRIDNPLSSLSTYRGVVGTRAPPR